MRLPPLRRVRAQARENVAKLLPPLDFTGLPLHAVMDRLWRVDVPVDVSGIEGWLSSRERRALYALGRALPGPFAEVGAWVGLSTTILCGAIRDSGTAKEFVTHELNPTLDWFRPHEDGIGFFPPGATAPFGRCSVAAFESGIRPVLSRPGGVLGQLEANLGARGFRDMVRIVVGDVADAAPRAYRFVFADVLHDAAEIAANAPKLRRLVGPGTVLACHDSTDANEALLQAHIPFRRIGRADSLLVCEVLG